MKLSEVPFALRFQLVTYWYDRGPSNGRRGHQGYLGTGRTGSCGRLATPARQWTYPRGSETRGMNRRNLRGRPGRTGRVSSPSKIWKSSPKSRVNSIWELPRGHIQPRLRGTSDSCHH
jgi:hypothetical protein